MTAPSARGLFRATGHTARKEKPREKHDFYATPPEVTRAFLAAEGPRLREIGGAVWEPACGDGAMVREIERYGLEVFPSDMIDRGCPGAEIRDFYSFDTAPGGARAIVTNPPYCEINARDGKGRWLVHSLTRPGIRYGAFFLNWDWPAAKGLAGILGRYPISRAYVCRWKVDFSGEGAPPQRNGWFVWDQDWRGECAFRFLDRRDGAQIEMFD